MFSVFRSNTVNTNNLLQYTLDGHRFGIAPLSAPTELKGEYEGAVEEVVYKFDALHQEEKKIKKRMDRMYLKLVHVDHQLSILQGQMDRIKLLQSTLFYPG